MISKSEVYNLDVFYSLALPNVGCGTLKYLISFFFFKHNHNVFRLQITMNNAKFMQENGGFDNISYDESTLELVKMLPLPDIFK